jgi:hypothetical protein
MIMVGLPGEKQMGAQARTFAQPSIQMMDAECAMNVPNKYRSFPI